MDKAKSAAGVVISGSTGNAAPQEVATETSEEKQASSSMFSTILNKAKDAAGAALGAAQSDPKAQQSSPNGATAVSASDAKASAGKQGPAPQSVEDLRIAAVVDPILADQDKIAKSKYVNAAGFGLTDEHMPYFAKQLKKLSDNGMEKLTLNLSGNAITAVGLASVLEALATHVKLVSVLDFSKNRIGDDGAILLAKCIQRLAIVNSIVLSGTGITGAGALELMTEISLQDDSLLELLDLSNNMITNDYWPLLAEKAKLLKKGVFEDGIDLSGNMLNLQPGTDIPAIIILGT
jgi:hypothetical protein